MVKRNEWESKRKSNDGIETINVKAVAGHLNNIIDVNQFVAAFGGQSLTW